MQADRRFSSSQDHLNVIHPDVGKRYRLNFSGEVNRLSIGKVKQSLVTASTCRIPLDQMVLKLNGVPLSDDRDICGALGIGSGATLTVEHRKHVEPYLHRRIDASGHDTVLDHMGSYVSPKRRQLEVQTVREQETFVHKDLEAHEQLLQSTLAHMEEELYEARLEKQRLERHRVLAEQGLADVGRREALTEREKEKLSAILAEETERAALRAADLERRREKLRYESEAMRAVAMQKLALEEHKARLAEERAQFSAEQLKIEQEQQMFEKLAKEREAQILAQEIELEHAQLAQQRQRQELEIQRRIATEQKLHYYRQLGCVDGPDSPEVMSFPSNIQRHHTQGGAALSSSYSIPEDTPSPYLYSQRDDVGFEDTRVSGRNLAEENLRRLGDSLGVTTPLVLDQNGSCAFRIGQHYAVLVSFDPTSDRLFLHSTLREPLPGDDAMLRLEVLKYLLEGLQPWNDKTAAGLSASIHQDSIILSTSVHLPSSKASALEKITPSFVRSLQEWNEKIAEFKQQRQSVQLAEPAGSSASLQVLGLEVTDTLIVNGMPQKCDDGVVVVRSSGLAAAASIAKNDWIKSVNGEAVKSKEDFHGILQRLLPQPHALELEVERRGSVVKVSIPLK